MISVLQKRKHPIASGGLRPRPPALEIHLYVQTPPSQNPGSAPGPDTLALVYLLLTSFSTSSAMVNNSKPGALSAWIRLSQEAPGVISNQYFSISIHPR